MYNFWFQLSPTKQDTGCLNPSDDILRKLSMKCKFTWTLMNSKKKKKYDGVSDGEKMSDLQKTDKQSCVYCQNQMEDELVLNEVIQIQTSEESTQTRSPTGRSLERVNC